MTQIDWFIVYLVHLLPYILIHTFAVFDGAQTSRGAWGAQSRFWKHSLKDFSFLEIAKYDEKYRQKVLAGETKFSAFDLRFVGGNRWYDPSYPWKADFWHMCKGMWVIHLPLLVLSSAGAVWTAFYYHIITTDLSWWYLWYASYCSFHLVEGKLFTFYFHFVFKKEATFEEWFVNYVLGKKVYD